MKKALEKYAKKLETDAMLARIRRVMWIDMDARIRKMFEEVKGSPHANWYGGIGIHNGLHPEAEELHVTDRLNHLQITCMTRLLGIASVKRFEDVKEIDGVEQKVRGIKWTTHVENESAMWFSQTPSGGVTVFMSPYKSDLVSMNEKEIIIGTFKDPSKLSERRIKKLFARYFKYMSITSALHSHTPLDYAWRLWLMYLDVRSRRGWKMIVAINVLIIFGGALFTILGYFLKS